MNRDWHKDHRLARTATLDARVAWHLEHAKACGCRAMPATIADEIARRSLEIDQAKPIA